MQERIDLGPGRAIRHDGDPDRCAVVLPGRFYPTRAPALWFAREAAMAAGWSALEVPGVAGVDHSLQVAGDLSASLAALKLLTESVARFAERA